REDRRTDALDAVVLVTQTRCQRPLLGKTVADFAEKAEIALGIVEERHAGQVESLVGLRMRIVKAGDAADLVVLVAEGYAHLVRGIGLVDIGVTTVDQSGDADRKSVV